MVGQRISRRIWIVGLVSVSTAVAAAQVAAPAKGVRRGVNSSPASQPAGPQPSIRLDKTVFDFGNVYLGEPARGEFTIENVGAGPLTISVRSSCGCTVATSPKSPLPPGEKTGFTITYATTHVGRASKTVTLTTNDPRQKTITIPVRGEVRPLFAADPTQNIVFQGLERDSRATQTVRLTNQYGQPLHLKLKPDQAFGPFEIEFREVKPGELYELSATTRPPLQMGANTANVVLETGLPRLPTMTMLVSATIQPPVSVTPNRLPVMGDRPMGTSTLIIVHRKTRPIHIESVRLGDRTLKHELAAPTPNQPESPTAIIRFRVALPAYDEIPDDKPELVIVTSDKEYHELVVPIVKMSKSPTGRPPAQPAGQTGPKPPIVNPPPPKPAPSGEE